MSTTVTLSLPEDQLDLLQDVQALLRNLADRQNATDWLTEKEAAARLKVSLSTIRKYRADGWLRYSAEGSSIKYKTDYLDEDFERRTMVTATLGPLMNTAARPPRRLAS